MKRGVVYAIFCFLLYFELHAQSLINIVVPPGDSFGLIFNDVSENGDGYFAVGTQTGVDRVILTVCRIGYSGNVIWKKDYRKTDHQGKEYLWWGAAIGTAKDGGCYVFVGEKSPAAETKGMLMKLDANGQEIWRTYLDAYPEYNPNPSGADGAYNQSDLIVDKEGNALVAGLNVQNGWSSQVVKINPVGAILFNKSFFDSQTDFISMLTNLAQTPDGGYIIVGPRTREDFRNGRDQAVMYKLSEAGQELWTQVYFTGYWDRGDSIKAYPLGVSVNSSNEITMTGMASYGMIANRLGFILVVDSTGAVKRNVIPLKHRYPTNINYKYINKVFALNNRTMYNLVDEGQVFYGVDLENYKDAISGGYALETGYSINNNYHNRRFELVNKFGHAVFVGGGQMFVNDTKNGLLLTTTPDGLWIPPTLVSLQQNTRRPWVISHTRPHITLQRVIEISTNRDFSNLVFQKEINKDSVQLDVRYLKDGSYFLRIGTKGPLFGNVVYNDPVEFKLENEKRFATRVLSFSSQYSSDSWSAKMALYGPDVYPTYGDNPYAWAASSADGQREYLEFGFDDPAKIKGIAIYETYNPGAIDTIYAKNPGSGNWEILYKGSAQAEPAVAREWYISFNPTPYPVSEIRLAINSPAVGGYNEIDAVGLVDDGLTQTKDIKTETSLMDGYIIQDDQLFIFWKEDFWQDKELRIISLDGSVLCSQKVKPVEKSTKLALNHIPRGVFIVQIESNHTRENFKILNK